MKTGIFFIYCIILAILPLPLNGQTIFEYTHYPLSADARTRVAVETHRFVRQTAGDLPFALTGDFNAQPSDLPIHFLS